MTAVLSGPLPYRVEWMSHPDRPCAHGDPEQWFSILDSKGPTPAKTAGRTHARAAALCAGCPVLAQCRAFALDDPRLVGVWGGTTPRQRRDLRKERP